MRTAVGLQRSQVLSKRSRKGAETPEPESDLMQFLFPKNQGTGRAKASQENSAREAAGGAIQEEGPGERNRKECGRLRAFPSWLH